MTERMNKARSQSFSAAAVAVVLLLSSSLVVRPAEPGDERNLAPAVVLSDNANVVSNSPTQVKSLGDAAESVLRWQLPADAASGNEQLSSAKLETVWINLLARGTTAFLVIRNDAVVFERYAEGWSRTKPHYTASLAKALVGGMALLLAMEDGRIRPDERASRFVPPWRGVERKQDITIRHLATHTSGIEDAEADGLPHDQLSGWKGEFWKRLAPPRDPFSLARDTAPVPDLPGTRARYSNPGMAMLAYCVTGSLRGSTNADLRSLLRHRVMEPLGVPEDEWSVGYGATTEVDGLPLVANWGGGGCSPNAVARVGRLLLRGGDWQGRQLLQPEIVTTATTHAGLPREIPQIISRGEPNNSGMGWWVNREADGSLHWKSAPADAFWGAGAGHQFLLVVPSLNLIVVRNGERLDSSLAFDEALETHVVAPLMSAFTARVGSPVPPSPVIKAISWAPTNTIVRLAKGSDNWPLTWADDDQLYTAYGDGNGFEPFVPEKLSLGFAKISGGPTIFSGANVRSPTGEQRGDGRAGRKASGLLCVEGVLYLWARNATNAQLAWSSDHGVTWTWSDWRFSTSFGCPAFVNFGRDYAGARDEFVYVYSPDSDSAYAPADRFVLARAPKRLLRERDAYEFFVKLDAHGTPLWTKDLAQRGAVFTNAGRCLRSQMTYCAPLRRYLWWQQLPTAAAPGDPADSRFVGGFGVYDAPEPWGPWTTAYFTERWDTGPGEKASFPTKWMSADGRTMHLVFSGDDSLSIRQAKLGLWAADASSGKAGTDRLRVIIETDAGGDPDDEQSLVRFLLYANEWDVEGIIANRATARDGENRNLERTGLGVVRRLVTAYGQCFTNLVQHDPRYPTLDYLWQRTVSGNEDGDGGVRLVIAAVDSSDPRPVWFCNWGTDHGSAPSSLKLALDQVRRERGPEGYAKFKRRLRLSSDDQFGEHTTKTEPPFPLWIDTFRPPLDGKRWYHRFSALTATAGGFDLQRDVLTGHGPLGALYPTNTTHWQKEGDTMSFLYLVPNGLGDPNEPTWGSWAGRYGSNPNFPGKPYYWANQLDSWQGTTNRDNTLLRWAGHLQNDFKARLDWCVKGFAHANHPPVPRIRVQVAADVRRLDLNEEGSRKPEEANVEPAHVGRYNCTVRVGEKVLLDASASSDPDSQRVHFEWIQYPEAGTYRGGAVQTDGLTSARASLVMPAVAAPETLHVLLAVTDEGDPPLTRYQRLVLTVHPSDGKKP